MMFFFTLIIKFHINFFKLKAFQNNFSLIFLKNPLSGPKIERRVCNRELCPLKLNELGSCACPGGAYFCSHSQSENRCQQGQRCEKVSMDPSAPYRCVSDLLGECRAAGDPHVYSFDGAHNDVYGVGKYVFAQFRVRSILKLKL